MAKGWFRFDDLTGRVFGSLTVVQYLRRDPPREGARGGGDHWWTCRCVCGNVKGVRSAHLKRGAVVSCGCHKAKIAGDRNRTHGKSKTREYRIWFGMLERCRNPKNLAFAGYGERGITVCRRWAKFDNFLRDMGKCPPDKYSIERNDNDSGYSRGNCRWATITEQNRNTRQNRNMTFNGKTQCLNAWAVEVGIPRTTIRGRMRMGWSVEKALTEPVRPMLGKVSTNLTS